MPVDSIIERAAKQATRVPKSEELMMDAGEIAHAKKYEELAKKIGIDELKKLIPASPEKIRKALASGDKHLNTIPLRRWDVASEFVKGEGLSLSDKVCILKHVATWHYA